MWVHIVIFILAFGTVLISKAGWIHLDALGVKRSPLFLAVAGVRELPWNGCDNDRGRRNSTAGYIQNSP